MSGRILTASLVGVLALGGTYGFAVQRRINGIDRRRITTTKTIPESFQQAKSIKDIVHTTGPQSMVDSRHIAIDIPAHAQNDSDEALLAKFIRSFFGGMVIGPERWALKTLGWTLVHRSKIESSPTTKWVWSTKDLPEKTLLPLHSILFGAFQLVDFKLAQSDPGRIDGAPTESYVDFAFGSDQFRFAGVHRFSVVRPVKGEHAEADRQTVEIHTQTLACNPLTNEPLKPDFIFDFHMVYADLLFREAVTEITNWLK